MQCVCYVSDAGYGFPTLVSALQARAMARPDTDVVVLFTESLNNFPGLKASFAAKGIQIMDVTDQAQHILSGLDRSHFSSRITPSTMGKLILDDLLPPQYEEVIYIDGDTQIVQPLEVLEAFAVPPGRFLAARDYSSVVEMITNGRDVRYFNAGVLKFNRSQWIGREALEFFATRTAECGGFHDQGALNAVGKQSVIFISSLWNFPKHFLHLLDDQRPSIIHYMSNPKPWYGAYFPWGTPESIVYDQALRDFPELRSLHTTISVPRRILYRYRSVKSAFESRRSVRPNISGLFGASYPI